MSIFPEVILITLLLKMAYLHNPRAVAREGVASAHQVPVPGERAKKVPHALHERVHLWVDQDLRDEVL